MVQNQTNTRSIIVGVMGGGSASAQDMHEAKLLGSYIAENNFILLNGGRNKGIMESSAKGAFKKGGLTIGILPGEDLSQTSNFINIPILTGMGNARNQINILSSHIVAAFKGGAGTISEIAFAIKLKKPLVLIDFYPGEFIEPHLNKTIFLVKNAKEAMAQILKLAKAS